MTDRSHQKHRPRSVIILALLQILQGAGLLSAGVYQAIEQGWDFHKHLGGWMYMPLPLLESLATAIVLIALGTMMLLVSLALLGLFRWAWLVSMSLQGFGLFLGIISYMRHRPNFLGMVLGILIVFYLNLDEVQTAFQTKRQGESP